MKKGDSSALKILGYSGDVSVNVDSFTIEPKQISMGDFLSFSIELSTDAEHPILIDYVISFMKANGRLAPKVFKWTQKLISPTTPIHLTKRHAFREITTRKYYPGRHEFHVQINGKVVASEQFNLSR